MTDLPSERPVQRRVDESAADLETLVDMGHVPEQPQPPDPVPEE